MDDNREFDVSCIFSPVKHIVGGGELISIEDPSVSVHGYQLLPLATSQLMGDSREFDVLGIFEVFYSLLVEGAYNHIRSIS